ncbi:GntR family transcriptional regulator [Salinibacterium hongtaonis]|uniref:GntR family transcriptional regulator n=1 Tax=Homoserinimonas hongtaonis TaxID=2079791 RepID=A0A2U1SXW9_9MICO|nr:GntR family transcriptional regulator [Salinibacterium hongtaonis]PWB96481.1 GntR family transcriptional regulator [Salinibacterium hongtaonis]
MITLDAADPTPPFEQIRRQLTDEIRSGRLAHGYRLPSVRQLAGDLGIAAGTVARAYAELEQQGLLESSRAGTRVGDIAPIAPEALVAARLYAAALKGLGVGLDDAIRAVRVEWTAAT